MNMFIVCVLLGADAKKLVCLGFTPALGFDKYDTNMQLFVLIHEVKQKQCSV